MVGGVVQSGHRLGELGQDGRFVVEGAEDGIAGPGGGGQEGHNGIGRRLIGRVGEGAQGEGEVEEEVAEVEEGEERQEGYCHGGPPEEAAGEEGQQEGQQGERLSRGEGLEGRVLVAEGGEGGGWLAVGRDGAGGRRAVFGKALRGIGNLVVSGVGSQPGKIASQNISAGISRGLLNSRLNVRRGSVLLRRV